MSKLLFVAALVCLLAFPAVSVADEIWVDPLVAQANSQQPSEDEYTKPKEYVDEFPEFRLFTFIDLRAARGSDAPGWMDEGLGKTRYGGDSEGKEVTVGRVAEASLVGTARFNWSTTGYINLKYDPEQSHSLDFVEAFINYNPVSISMWKLTGRIGAFFPPGSLENKAIAWTSPYTITSSALNTWIGEELRTIGAELSLTGTGNDAKLEITGALFGKNDTTGTILAWRGWAMSDRKTGLFDRFNLPSLPSLAYYGAFSRNAKWEEPFVEVDDRPGYYVYASLWWQDWLTLNAMHYDNLADPAIFDGTQYAWWTAFNSFGASLALPYDVEILAQGLYGETIMGKRYGGKLPVDNTFDALYILVSKTLDIHRVSIRYDRFNVQDRDSLVANDNNNETGHGWTIAYSVKTFKGQHLMLEYLNVVSDREAREYQGRPIREDEKVFQASYRIVF